MAVQSSANRVTRLLGMDADPVNQSWLCDKGRFGYESANSEDRLMEPLVRRQPDGALEPASWAEALALVGERLGDVRAARGAAAVGVVGGARLSNEDAYAWAKLAKGVIGTDNVDAQLADGIAAEVVLALPRATIDEACRAACVLTLTGDLREELPVLFLRLRMATDDGSTTIVELSPVAGALTPSAVASVGYRPGAAPALIDALAAGADAPEGTDPGAWSRALHTLAAAGDGGEGVVVVLGRPSLAEHQGLVAEAALRLSAAWPRARFLPALRRGNVMGALEMGLAPGLLPGRVSLDDGAAWFEAAWGTVPAERGLDTAAMLEAVADGDIEVLVLLGADPVGDFPDRALAERALGAGAFVVAVDTFLSPSAALADVVLPATAAHERGGTTTNIEGRVARLGQKLVAPGQCWPDWMIAAELAARLGGDLGVTNVAELADEIERLATSRAGITRSVLDSPAARDGVLSPLAPAPVGMPRRRVPAPFDPMATPGIEAVERQGAPPRAGLAEAVGGDDVEAHGPRGSDGAASDSGGRPPMLRWPQVVEAPHVPALDAYSLRLVSSRRLYDEGSLVESSPSLAPLAHASTLRVHPAELERLGVASGGRVRVRSARGTFVLEAVPDAGVPKGVAVVPFNVAAEDGSGVASLIDAAVAVVDVRLETP